MNFRMTLPASSTVSYRHLRMTHPAFMVMAAASLLVGIAPAAIVLPDITVNSMGVAYDGDLDYYVSGVNTSTGLGSAASSSFAGGSAMVGENVSVLIKPQAGYAFSLLPGYDDLRVSFAFESAPDPTFHDATPTFEFLGVEGGTMSSFTSIRLTTGETRVHSRGATSNSPSAPITFTGLKVSWSQPAPALTFTLMSFSGMYLHTTASADPADTTAYLSLVAVPEPGRMFLLGTGILFLSTRRRRIQASA
jgi:hypothetical protein